MIDILTAILSLILFIILNVFMKFSVTISSTYIASIGFIVVWVLATFGILTWWVEFSWKHKESIDNFFNKIPKLFHKSIHHKELREEVHGRNEPKKTLDDNPNLQKFYKAIENKDEEAAYEALEKNADECPNRNSYCLTEVFCPECPLVKGGLSVPSARENWSAR